MTKVSDIYNYLCELAPLELQMGFDNSGFQLGRRERVVEKVLLALDVTDAVVDEAMEIGANLIVSHHPLIFKGIKSVDGNEPEEARILKLIENGIAVISMHTNLDIVDGGVNDVLISLLGANALHGLDSEGCGRVGMLEEPVSMKAFLRICREKLNVNGIRYYDAERPVSKLAVMGGAGGDSLEDAYKHGCDTYVTADIKYHQFIRAAELNINLIDADHFCTENPVIFVLCEKLSEKFADTQFYISKKHKAIISFA